MTDLHKSSSPNCLFIRWLDFIYLSIGKRLLDLLIGAIGVLFLTLVYVPIALAIRLDSRGPIFFVQVRAGIHEQPFRMVKFRTMKWPPVLEINTKPETSQDERLTRVGHLLRRTSLDELPQFLHVLHGEMSFIGPRPELVDRLALYKTAERQRSAVKPGITGWWQVHARPQPMQEYAYLDLYYVDHLSFWLDMQILARTIPTVLSSRGAR
jgi:sugar transferase EpsL